MPTEQEYQDHYDEGFEEGRKQLIEYIGESIEELRNSFLIAIDKPKEDCPIVTWNYSIVFIRNVLQRLKEDLSKLTLLTGGNKNG